MICTVRIQVCVMKYARKNNQSKNNARVIRSENVREAAILVGALCHRHILLYSCIDTYETSINAIRRVEFKRCSLDYCYAVYFSRLSPVLPLLQVLIGANG